MMMISSKLFRIPSKSPCFSIRRPHDSDQLCQEGASGDQDLTSTIPPDKEPPKSDRRDLAWRRLLKTEEFVRPIKSSKTTTHDTYNAQCTYD